MITGKNRMKLKLFTVVLIAFLLIPILVSADTEVVDSFDEIGGSGLKREEVDWDTGHDALVSDDVTKNNTIILGTSYPSGAVYRFQRGVFFFNLSTLPSDATITGANITFPTKPIGLNTTYYILYDSNGVHPNYSVPIALGEYNISNYDSVVGTFNDPQTEDFRTWSYSNVTANTSIGRTADIVTLTKFLRSAINTSLYSKPTIPANFSWDWNLNVTGLTSATNTYRAWMGLAQEVDAYLVLKNDGLESMGIMVYAISANTTHYKLAISSTVDTVESSSPQSDALSVNTMYYLSWTRLGENSTLGIYADESRTQLVQSINRTITNSDTWELNYMMMPDGLQYATALRINATLSDLNFNNYTWVNHTVAYPQGILPTLTNGTDPYSVAILSSDDWLDVETNDNSTSVFGTGAHTLEPTLSISYTTPYGTLTAEVDIDPPQTIEADGYLFPNKWYDFDVTATPEGNEVVDTVWLRLNDGYHSLEVKYDSVEGLFEILNGGDYFIIKQGSVSGSVVTFQLMLKDTVSDAYAVDLYSKFNTTLGSERSWSKVINDAFNIYNLGGHTLQTVTGTASESGFLTGGAPWNIWANASGNGYMTEMEFRYIQQMTWNPTILVNSDPADGRPGLIEYGIKTATDQFAEGFRVQLQPQNLTKTILTNDQIEVVVYWQYYSGGQWNNLTSESIWARYIPTTTESFWFVNLWVDRTSGSTVYGGRVDCQYFLKPILGSEKQTTSTASYNILNKLDAVMPIGNSSMMRVWEKVLIFDDAYMFNITGVTYNVRQGTPEGVDSPELTPPRPYNEGWNPFAFLYKAIANLGTSIINALGFGSITILSTLVGWLDGLAGAFGIPLFFTNITSWIALMWTRVTSISTSMFSVFTPIFSVIGVSAGKYVFGVTAALTVWVSWITVITGLFTGGYNMGINFWTEFNLSTWFTLIAAMYPLYLIDLASRKGMTAALTQVEFMVKIVMSLVTLTLTLLDSLLTMISTAFAGVGAVK